MKEKIGLGITGAALVRWRLGVSAYARENPNNWLVLEVFQSHIFPCYVLRTPQQNVQTEANF
eukprot:4102779-Pyramimonas_sp.AAC.1